MDTKKLGLLMDIKDEDSAKNMVYLWESGRRSPGPKNLLKLAKIFGRTIQEIQTDKDLLPIAKIQELLRKGEEYPSYSEQLSTIAEALLESYKRRKED